MNADWSDLDADRTIRWPNDPALVAGADSTELLVADFTGDSLIDAVLLSTTGVPYLASGVEVLEAVATVRASLTGVTSIANLPAVQGVRPSLLLASDSSGLYEVPFASNGLSFDIPSLVASNWAGVQDMSVATIGSGTYLLGVGANGMTIDSLLVQGSSYTPGPSWSVSTPILDYEVLDFEGDGIDELAVLILSDLIVFPAAGGTPLRTIRSADGPTGSLAVVGSPTVDSLAWMLSLPNGSQMLTCVTSTGIETPLSLTFPLSEGASSSPVAFGGLAAGDMNVDGHDDLVIFDANHERSIVLWNDPTSDPRFSGTTEGDDYQQLNLSNTPSNSGLGNVCEPVVVDINGDGIQDVVQSVATVEGLLIFTQFEDVIESVTGSGEVNFDESKYVQLETRADLDLVLDVSPQDFNNFEGVQILLSEQQGAGEASLQPDMKDNIIYGFDLTGAYKHQVTITIPQGSSQWPEDWHYYVYYRFVNYTIGGNDTVTVQEHSSFRMGGLSIHQILEVASSLEDEFPYLDSRIIGDAVLHNLSIEDFVIAGASSLGAFTFPVLPPPTVTGAIPSLPVPRWGGSTIVIQ